MSSKNKLSEEQQEMWDKLTYVPPPIVNFDINSMYANVFGVQPMEAPTGKTYKLKVLKSR